MKTYQKKVCLLGDFAVGKTSLVRRYVKGRFDDKYLSTIGVKISRKTINRPSYALNLLLWDLAGGDSYHDTASGYLRGASGALVICDLTRANTTPSLRQYITQLRTFNPQVALFLLGNKLDLTAEREISTETLQTLSEEFGCPYLLTSAKTGEGVTEAFEQLADLLDLE